MLAGRMYWAFRGSAGSWQSIAGKVLQSIVQVLQSIVRNNLQYLYTIIAKYCEENTAFIVYL